MNCLLLLWLLIPGPAAARGGDVTRRDTSFTLRSAFADVRVRFPSARIAATELAPGTIVVENAVYAAPGGRKLHLDLLRRDDGLLRPAVLLVHGGGWRSGDRSMSIPLARVLAARGYVAAAMEYRLSSEALYPAAVYDLKAAVRWLRAQSATYRIDSGRIAVLGCSAGGQLAALLGTTNGDPRFEGYSSAPGHSSSVQAVVDIDGILDFTDPAESGKDTIPGKLSAGAAWFGATYRQKPELWIEASPLVHVDAHAAPIVFINSSSPRFHAGRDSMIARLNKLNIYTEVHTLPGTPHPFWLFHPWFEPTCDYVTAFLDKVFGVRR